MRGAVEEPLVTLEQFNPGPASRARLVPAARRNEHREWKQDERELKCFERNLRHDGGLRHSARAACGGAIPLARGHRRGRARPRALLPPLCGRAWRPYEEAEPAAALPCVASHRCFGEIVRRKHASRRRLELTHDIGTGRHVSGEGSHLDHTDGTRPWLGDGNAAATTR